MNFAAPLVVALDEGVPIVVLAGVHAGCFELFVSEKIRTISDLKGKMVAILATRSSGVVGATSQMAQSPASLIRCS